ncbi:Release factor glutamine methyltransferase [Linum perenne]
MQLSFTRACFYSRPICYASRQFSGAVTKPQIPLFERPPIHSATSLQLQKWHGWAKSLASSVGSSFVEADNGPDSTLLCRELNWLLEDALDNPSSFKYPSTEGVCENVKLRASLDDLYRLWKDRIENRRPLQYLVGCEHWRDLVLSVEEGVLIPRPETELIVDLVANLVSTADELRNGLWADLGTGSGALAIGIGRLLGSSGRVIATDASPLAVSVSSFNVQRYGLQDLIEVRQGSWFEPLKNVEGKLSGFVSNPPYIPSNNMLLLQAEVGKHEPTMALDGGDSGMDCLLQLCTGAATMLKPGGFFALEASYLQYIEVSPKEIAVTGFCFRNILRIHHLLADTKALRNVTNLKFIFVQDLQLQNQFKAMDVPAPGCASIIKSILGLVMCQLAREDSAEITSVCKYGTNVTICFYPTLYLMLHRLQSSLPSTSSRYGIRKSNDGGNRGDPHNLSQEKRSLLEKMIRLDVHHIPSAKAISEMSLWGNYSIPRDNPYQEDEDLEPEIWAMVNIVSKGGNYAINKAEGSASIAGNLFVQPEESGNFSSSIELKVKCAVESVSYHL